MIVLDIYTMIRFMNAKCTMFYKFAILLFIKQLDKITSQNIRINPNPYYLLLTYKNHHEKFKNSKNRILKIKS